MWNCANFNPRESFVVKYETLIVSNVLEVSLLVLVEGKLVKGQVCIRAKWPVSAGAYPGFCSMKRLGIFQLPPGWDASPSQGYPHH